MNYVVTKIPRFAFEVLAHGHHSARSLQMATIHAQHEDESVGEAMAIGRTFMDGEHARPACRFRRPRRNQPRPTPDSVSVALTDAREGACAPLRSLEIDRSGLGGDGKPWRIGTEVYGDRDILPRDVISRKLSVPNAERIFFIRHALRAGFTIQEIFGLTKIDR